MNKLLETVMNFINENTQLLIIICIFLIFPKFSFAAPYTTFEILDCSIAPQHIIHGSIVTYKTQSSNRQLLIFLDAFDIAINSA